MGGGGGQVEGLVEKSVPSPPRMAVIPHDGSTL